MEENKPAHEKLFDEISLKLNELSGRDDQILPHQQKLEKMQTQLKKFHHELQDTQDEFRQKLRSLEGVQFTQHELNSQLKSLNDQLNQERAINNKLNADLAKSLEISLQLQLEIQGVKARTVQIQNEEKRYSQSLSDKLKATQNDLELTMALKDELSLELSKAKASYQKDQENLEAQKSEILHAVEEKDAMIEKLNQEIESLSQSLNEIEESGIQQNSAIKNLMTVAENKIVELKMALDKKEIESQGYYSHLQQALTQASLLRQENQNLKDYIQKVNLLLQQQHSLQNQLKAPDAEA